jgi:catechol 2,3-dioxygenase-like lactoylglutathione lyase family enzyme
MISGAHVVVYSKNVEADRAFVRDVLGLKSVDAGHRWLIFALPTGEATFHPSGENGPHELHFMCTSLKAEMALAKQLRYALRDSGSTLRVNYEAPASCWRRGGRYEPKHPTA